jgi:hypothetical protein
MEEQHCITFVLLTYIYLSTVWNLESGPLKQQWVHHNYHLFLIIIIIIIIIIIMSCEVLGVVPVLYPSRWSWSFHLFLGRPMLLFPFGLYFSACLGSLSASILSTCCSHSRWHCFISKTMFCTPSFSLTYFSNIKTILMERSPYWRTNKP